jgi:hypothetical protein
MADMIAREYIGLEVGLLSFETRIETFLECLDGRWNSHHYHGAPSTSAMECSRSFQSLRVGKEPSQPPCSAALLRCATLFSRLVSSH